MSRLIANHGRIRNIAKRIAWQTEVENMEEIQFANVAYIRASVLYYNDLDIHEMA